MKELYGLKEKDIAKLRKAGYIDNNTIVDDDKKSIIDGSPLFVVFFDNSEQRDKAYNIIFNKQNGGEWCMIGDYKNAMDLWLIEVKHTYDEHYEVVGIFGSEEDIIVAKDLYLKKKEEAGLNRSEFSFRESKYALGEVNY